MDSSRRFDDFSLNDWLLFLQNRYKKEIHLGLERIKAVASKLELDKELPLVILVGGTNGKGSTVASLSAIYQTAGYNVGSYTSPHLINFNERICINDKQISDLELISSLKYIELNRGDVPLSFFEVVTLAALHYFKQFKLDIIILEVGLGGRLDATNILSPDLAIITSIGLDHQQYLGNTIEQIAYEKAGILRKNIPFIYSSRNMPNSIKQRVIELNNNAYRLGYEYDYNNVNGYDIIINNKIIKLPASGVSKEAMASAVVAVTLLQDKLPLSVENIQKALMQVKISGRIQIFKKPRLTILDVAHNIDAIKRLKSRIQDANFNGNIHCVFGIMADKDIVNIINYLKPIVKYWYPTELDYQRAADKKTLQDVFNFLGRVKVYATPVSAYKSAVKYSKPEDIILACGSFLTVGAILKLLQEREEEALV